MIRSPLHRWLRRLYACVAALAVVGPVAAGTLDARVDNAVSGERLAGLAVSVHERLGNGELRWVRSAPTDAEGRVTFDLAGLGAGTVYVLGARPYGQRVESAPITAAGFHRFAVGRLEVVVRSGADDALLTDTAVVVRERFADGTLGTGLELHTDAAGRLRLDRPLLSDGSSYVLRATSTLDGSEQHSAPLAMPGAHTFTVGGAGLEVRVLDALSGAALDAVEVTAWERLADATLTKVRRLASGPDGRVTFDLAGLGTGRAYVLGAAPYGWPIESPVLTATGEHVLRAGTLQVEVVKGLNGKPMREEPVTLHRIEADGSRTLVLSATTDHDATVRLDPPGLGAGTRYVLRAASPVDATAKDSAVYDAPGAHTFSVGGEGLWVRVDNAVSGERLAGLAVSVHERLGNGELRWVRSAPTDAEGRVTFDLAGLGAGRAYVLGARPYGQRVESAPITAAGFHRFAVGHLEVRLVKGLNGKPMREEPVTLHRIEADGSRTLVLSATTDHDATVRLDPPGLGAGTRYVLRAASPVDATAKDSAVYDAPGAHTFSVGGEGLWVRVDNAVSGERLAGLAVSVHERLGNGELRWVRSAPTDAEGRVTFDLAGLGAGTVYVLGARPYGQRVESAPITAAGFHRFAVGRLEVVVRSGADDALLTDTAVVVRERFADGTLGTGLELHTDAAGRLRLDRPLLSDGSSYVLRATSTLDGSEQHSAPLAMPGAHTFTVGGAGLEVRVLDALSGAALDAVEVTAWERLADATLTKVRRLASGPDGRVTFDLAGLGTGRAYVLGAAPYGWPIESPVLTATGEHVLRAGTLQVEVVKGLNGKPMREEPVTLHRIEADGSRTLVLSATTDHDATVRLDPPGLGAGTRYVLRAASPVDATAKDSAVYDAPGAHTFSVGGEGLWVRVDNAVSGERLAGLAVSVHERLGNGELRWVRSAPTDAEGRVTFDLAGLGAGRAYVLGARPYGQRVESAPITAAGFHRFAVGHLEVRLVKGLNGKPMREEPVTLHRIEADGSRTLVLSATTDHDATVRLDPPGLGAGTRYVLRAASPVDATAKDSAVYDAPGAHTFSVGGEGLWVRVDNAVSGERLAGLAVSVHERLGNGELRWVRSAPTDAEGRVTFDLAGLGAGTVYVLGARPYGQRVESAPITAAGFHRFAVGRLEVVVRSGADDALLTDTAVVVRERFADGTLGTGLELHTDAAGRLRLDRPLLSDGSSYVLRATSTLDGSEQHSAPLAMPGAHTFTVGGAGLEVRVLDALSGAALDAVEVTAWERLADATLTKVRRLASGPDGRVTFDLAGLGTGRAYVLGAAPYGWPIESPVLTATGEHLLRAGTLQVYVVDAADGAPVPGVEVAVLEKDPGGALTKLGTEMTGGVGRARLDVPGLDQGRVYLARVIDPPGAEGAFFSEPIVREGPVTVRVGPGAPSGADLEPPAIAIARPGAGADVAEAGFDVVGYASDDVELDAVRISVEDDTGVALETSALYHPRARRWTASVPAHVLAAGTTITVRARATDAGLNVAQASRALHVVADTTAPTLTITSHGDGASVPAGRPIVSGSISDDTGVAALTVLVRDGAGAIVDGPRDLDVSASGRWALAMPELAPGEAVTVALTGTDHTGHAVSAGLGLVVGEPAQASRQILDRATFGVTLELIAQVEVRGIAGFVDDQLAPAAIDDSALEALVADWVPATKHELKAYALLRALYSRRQLLEVMTWFWENHFSTDYGRHRVVAYELAENQALRAHALGRFRDLLEVSATSPAMLVYLDGMKNKKVHPNENYARELLELHTIGLVVEPETGGGTTGFSEADVIEVARAFTGWRIADDAFHFDAGVHDFAEKQLLGVTLAAGGGIEDGLAVLDLVADHPLTADHVCRKLAVYLVSALPPESLIDACRVAFLEDTTRPDQLAHVVRTLLLSQDFSRPVHYRGRLKSPLHFVTSAVRLTDPDVDPLSLAAWLDRLGMPLFEPVSPDGFPMLGEYWMGTGQLLERARFAHALAFEAAPPGAPPTDLRPWFTDRGYETAEGIAAHLLAVALDADHTDLDLELAIATVGAGFTLADADAEDRIADLLRTVLAHPSFQFR